MGGAYILVSFQQKGSKLGTFLQTDANDAPRKMLFLPHSRYTFALTVL
jgi:hypothetical protein